MTTRIARTLTALAVIAVSAFGLTRCATLGQVVQAPIFELAPERSSSVRLVGPAVGRPLGGARLQIWARVENPNPIGFTLSRLAGTVLLDDQPAADVDLPLGLPLQAAQDTVIPLTLTLNFADIPGIADHLQQALSTGTIRYGLQGTLAVDAGPLGQPSFGPRMWIEGNVNVTR